MVMRVGGIASGMDIEALVEKLMEAERMPLDRLKQQQTTLTWKRDAFREINSTLLELDNMMLDMKLSTTYNPKSATSSQEGALTATANSSALNGSYEIRVDKLATNEMRISGELNVSELGSYAGDHEFYTYDENGDQVTHTLTINETDTIDDVLKKIGEASDKSVRAFYDENTNRVVLETTRTGVYNTENANGNEIEFDEASANSFFTDFLQLGKDG